MERGIILKAWINNKKEKVPDTPLIIFNHRFRPNRFRRMGQAMMGIRNTPRANRPMAVCQTVRCEAISLIVMFVAQ